MGRHNILLKCTPLNSMVVVDNNRLPMQPNPKQILPILPNTLMLLPLAMGMEHPLKLGTRLDLGTECRLLFCHLSLLVLNDTLTQT